MFQNNKLFENVVKESINTTVFSVSVVVAIEKGEESGSLPQLHVQVSLYLFVDINYKDKKNQIELPVT